MSKTPSYAQIVAALMDRPERTVHSIIVTTDDLTPFLKALYEDFGTVVMHDSFTIEHQAKNEWEIRFEVKLNGD